MPANCAKPLPIYHSYYVVMQDYGRRGREAVVDPEITCRGVIERITSGEYKNIVFVHHVSCGVVEDITDEVMGIANANQLQAAE